MDSTDFAVRTGHSLDTNQLEAFHRDGYLVLPGVLTGAQCDAVSALVRHSLDPLVGPVEYEAQVGYPGSPEGMHSEGGQTPRRAIQPASSLPVTIDKSYVSPVRLKWALATLVRIRSRESRLGVVLSQRS